MMIANLLTFSLFSWFTENIENQNLNKQQNIETQRLSEQHYIENQRLN